MVAHANSLFDAAATMASSTTTTRRPPPFAAMAPRSSSRTGSAKKARTGRRRCVEAIGRKMDELRRLVPSGHSTDDEEAEDDGVDELLFRAADYIVRLQVQVKAMQLMVDVLEEHTKDS